MKKVRYGNWVKGDEDNWVAIDNISEIRIEYQGKETEHQDYYELLVILKQADFWLPNNTDKETARKHGNFYNQMSDPQRVTIYLGPKKECEDLALKIMGLKLDQGGVRSSAESLYEQTRATSTTTSELEHPLAR